MPEIKNQFTGGKMNKDLDERLVPKGEYRDAMNIQVSTSEGSDVGAVQNILGNKEPNGCSNLLNSIGNTAFTVGSVADEKTDSLYWLVSGNPDINAANINHRDSIWKFNENEGGTAGQGGCTPVFVDNYGLSLSNGLSSAFNDSLLTNFTGSSILPGELEVGWTVTGVTSDGTSVSNSATITNFDVAQNVSFSFGFNPNTTTTNVVTGVALNPLIDVASRVSLLMQEDGSGNWLPVNTNIVYLSDFTGNIADLVGDTIEIDAYSGNIYTINAAVLDFVITFISGPFGNIPTGVQSLIKLTLDSNLNTSFGTNGVLGTSQPPAITGSGNGLAFQFSNGINISALITSSDQVTTNVATGELVFDPSDFTNNFSNAAIGDTVAVLGAGFSNTTDYCISAINPGNNSIYLEDCQTGVLAFSGFQVGGFVYGTPQPEGGEVLFAGGSSQLELDQNLNLTTGNYTTLFFQGPRTLNFDRNTLVTGINIIDDMLFWTDNTTEPKKINIQRSIDGTYLDGTQHTRLLNSAIGLDISDNIMVREKHITVIKNSPKNVLNIELSDGRDPLLDYTGITRVGLGPSYSLIINSNNPLVQYDFSALQIGDTVSFEIETDYNLSASMNFAWEEGGYLLLKELSAASALIPTPLNDWTIRGLITGWQYNKFENIAVPNSIVRVEIEVVGLNGTPLDPDPSFPNNSLYYAVDYEDTEPVIFEDKFPRFSYRYKYEDGEYSTFAPWSDVAFLPKGFDYDPKHGFNTGMINNVKEIKLKGFQPVKAGHYFTSTGKDVVEVDILYKEDVSPNVYLVQTISPIDILPSGMSLLPWNSDEYIIKSETIKSIIASNQLLRTWDNVPKKALAQDVSGNRIIYANYEQNYDLTIGVKNYKPDFKNSLVSWSPPQLNIPNKSIKSLRDYKLGVVFTDKYGRETPVLISESGGFKVDKINSINANRLKVGLRGNVPPEMAYYKFYIKETSSEYYNLAMDRWYNAEDGNLWLAFPSSDRNKVDLDTSLYFKRGEDGNKNVLRNSTEYKILAIENEAPEFIKTRRIRIGTVRHYANTAQIFGTTSAPLDNAPAVNGISFNMDYDAGGFEGTSLSNMEDITEDLYIQFISASDASAQYKVSEITSDRVDATATSGVKLPESYFITLATNLKDDINFIFNNAAAPSHIQDGVGVVFTKAVIENKPQFDGRFFAKIENDGKIQTQITDDSIGVNYIETISKKVYVLDHDGLLQQSSSAAVVEGSSYGNLVTYDWSGFITGGSSLQQAENPNGTNWNFLAARNAYFQKGNNIATTDNSNEPSGVWPFAQINSLFHPGLKSPLGISSFNQSRKFSVDQDEAGVWFIDRSTKKYKLSTTGLSDNVLDWPDTNHMNHASPACTFATDCGAYSNEQTRIGGGITHSFSSSVDGESTVNLGFGGFGGIGTWWEGDSGSNCAQNHWWFDNNPKDNYFGVGTTNGNWNDTGTTKFVGALEAGFKFKWREDPTETVYTLVGQTSYQKNLRFGRADDSICSNTTHLIGALSSYTKIFTFNVTPSMRHWDPAATPGTYLDQNNGKGLVLGDGVLYSTNISATTAVSSGDSVIYLTDISNLQVGMSAGLNTNIPSLSKITSINPVFDTVNGGYPVTVDLATSGTISVGTTVTFAFTIRIVEAHVYGVLGNQNEPRNNYIVVDSDFAECSNGNSLKPTYSLKKGMALHSYNIDSAAADPLAPIIIEKIEPHVSGYKITLAGYHAPMNYYNSGGTLGTNFVLEERLIFKQISMNGASNFTEQNTRSCQVNAPTITGGTSVNELGMIAAVGYDMVMVEGVDEYSDGGNLPENPFVWETEPKEDNDLDIYYEISENLPTVLSSNTIQTAIPVGSKVENASGEGGDWANVNVVNIGGQSGKRILISEFVWSGPGNAPDGTPPIESGSLLTITKPNGVIFSVTINQVIPDPISTNVSRIFEIKDTLHHSNYRLNWHNCYSFGNGVESNRIKDTFNSPFILNGVKASTTLGEFYKQERRKNSFIYSGIYNSTSGTNNLNQFIAAEKITKDINPIYGSIQKIHAGWSQGGDLVALCEDRILKILANKDALFNADGNSNLTSTNNVLGQAIPYSGEYGISKNPESFASEAYRIYFTDKVRGTVMRLSMDGLTPISIHGMKDWFRDNLKLNNTIIGSYDDKKDEYNVTLQQTTEQTPKTVTFKENVKGWVSFKSFTPENAISCANEYYTFKNGNIWKHHDESVNRNTFYNEGQSNSTINVILNDVSGSVKSFSTINYEGSQSRVVPNLQDNQYYNLASKPGWYVDSVFTNKESGSLEEFIEKEGKWFNYIKGKEVQHFNNNIMINSDGSSSFDQASFAIQGLGILGENPHGGAVIYGCTDSNSSNYDPNATVNDGSCELITYGCTDPSAFNHNEVVNTDDGSCVWLGCTDPYAINTDTFTEAYAYNGGVGSIVDDGSCIDIVNGCTDSTQFNYNPNANTDDGSCIAVELGCMEPTANDNYNPLANTENGTCVWYGCTDDTTPANNYLWEGPTVDDLATNQLWHQATLLAGGDATGYSPANSTYGMQDSTSTICTYDIGCTDPVALNYDSSATTDDSSCIYCDWYAGGGSTSGSHIYTATITNELSPSANDGEIFVAINTVTAPYQPIASVSLLDAGGGFITSVGPVNNTATFSNLAPGDYYVSIDGNSFTTNNGSISCTWNGFQENLFGMHTVGAAPVGIPGCTDPSACNTCTNGCTVDNGTCEYTSCAGCTDSTAFNYDASATIDDGSCIASVYGCTDPTANNENPSANVDDGSCTYDIYGCMDSRPRNDLAIGSSGALEPAALNYDPTATRNEVSASDSSNPCTYNTSASTIGDSPLGPATGGYSNFLGYDAAKENWTVKMNAANTAHGVWAVFNVGDLPLIQWPGYYADGSLTNTCFSPAQSTDGTRFSYATARTSGCQGNINSYIGGACMSGSTGSGFRWYYSTDDGDTWTDGNTLTYTNGIPDQAIELVRFNKYVSSTCASSKIDWTTYPNGYTGRFKQDARFSFLEWEWNVGINLYTEQPPVVAQYTESKYVNSGCKFSNYCNYDSSANFPTGTTYNPCGGGTPGCLDPNACNGDPYASCGGGTCTYQTWGVDFATGACQLSCDQSGESSFVGCCNANPNATNC